MSAEILTLTSLSMAAFAANSLLCRIALKNFGIDPASFTTIRLASGAIVLYAVMRVRCGPAVRTGDWPSAFALFAATTTLPRDQELALSRDVTQRLKRIRL